MLALLDRVALERPVALVHAALVEVAGLGAPPHEQLAQLLQQRVGPGAAGALHGLQRLPQLLAASSEGLDLLLEPLLLLEVVVDEHRGEEAQHRGLGRGEAVLVEVVLSVLAFALAVVGRVVSVFGLVLVVVARVVPILGAVLVAVVVLGLVVARRGRGGHSASHTAVLGTPGRSQVDEVTELLHCC